MTTLTSILLIEDDEDDYLLTAELLARIGEPDYALSWVDSFEAGVRTLLSEPPDLCLVDFRLGEHTGLDLLREVNERGCTVPIVVLTGQAEHEFDVAAMKAGAADYLVKGEFGHAQLERSIRYAIERSRSLAALRELNAELQRARTQVADASQAESAALTATLREQAELLDLSHDAILVRQRDGTITFWNRGAERIHGHSRAAALGRDAGELLRTELPVDVSEIDAALDTRGYWEGELRHTRDDGRIVITASRWVLRLGVQRSRDAVLQIDTDITERKHAEQLEAQRQEGIIRAQARAIEELSTPLIPITDEILVMPLIGMMDSMRARQVMQSLLEGLAASRGKVVIVDITGVPVVDTAVAGAILKAAHAARLLGAEVILTGIRPEVAQTLVHIEADLSRITTRGTLQSGINHALGRDRLGDPRARRP